jgi:hypothetical protein
MLGREATTSLTLDRSHVSIAAPSISHFPPGFAAARAPRAIAR